MNLRFVSALLVAIIAANGGAQTKTREDSVVVAKALDAVRAFQKRWERAWLTGQRAQRSLVGHLPPGVKIMGDAAIRIDPRGPDVACPPEAIPWTSDHAWGLFITKRMIKSDANKKHGVCPNWRPPPDYYLSQSDLPDERLSIDNALESHARAGIARGRDTLIRQLALAFTKAPGDSVLIGQYIRMLVDKRNLVTALVVADNCQARGSWCLALRGYVSYHLRQTFDAEDAFLQSIDSLSPAQACAATSVGVLLDEDARKNYVRLPCEKQDSVNRALWWLADPLWSVPGNDRFVEQRARKVLIAVHGALGRDERYNWISYGGGDALAAMIERYGWMSYTYANPPTAIISAPDLNDIYSRIPKDIAVRRFARSLGGWKTTFEYSVGRVHLIPPMEMVNDPFSITNADWSMNAPGGEWDFTFNWWPVEHYAPLNPLTKLVDQQTAFLRRQDSTLLAFATNLARTDLARKLGDSVTGVILTSPGPGSIRRAAEKRLGAQDRLTFLSALPTVPSLVSVEVPWDADGQRAARSRFGVKPPPPLSAMHRGEAAMSDPVILIVPTGVTALPSLADSAIALMNGSTTLAAGTSAIGVYWETYGIAGGDSVEVTVSLQQRGGGGSPVTNSWREPQDRRAVRTIASAVPIQMRSLILEVSALPVGAYTLELSVRRQNGQTLRTERNITIR